MSSLTGMTGFPSVYGTSGDFATMMMLQQMQNGGNQSVWGSGWNGNQSNTGNGVTGAAELGAKSGGFSFGKALGYGLVGGGAAGAGMMFTNNQFNSAIGEKGKFNEKFLKSFAGEYAQLKNGDKLANFVKGLSNAKTPITAENFGATFDSIEDFIKSGDVDDLTDEAKQVLKKQFKIKVNKAALEGLRSTIVPTGGGDAPMDSLKQFYAKTINTMNGHLTANDINAYKGLLAELDDITGNWEALGKGADSIPDKLAFLKQNAHALGINDADYQKLLRNADDITSVNELNKIFNKYGTEAKLNTRRTALQKKITNIEKAMQKYATKWDKNAGFWGQKGFKAVGDKKTLTALNNALKSMRKSKAVPVAIGAAALSAIVSCFM